MSTALANFLFEAANFLLLAAALGWLLFKPVRAALEADRDRHTSEEQKIADLRREAEELMEQARQARESAAHEIEQERREVLAGARQEAARIEEESRKAQQTRLETLEHEIEAARHAQAARLGDTLGRLAAASVRRLLETLDGPSLDVALIRGACGELRALPEEARMKALVEVAKPLGDEARRLLRDVLGGEFEERTVRELGAGVRVTTSAGQVDASALAVARQAARAVGAAVASPPEKTGDSHD